ncbi:adenosine deaminase-like protein isoform X2 [Patiria miniata]|uniref:Adenosine deaminase domain-containing protein n=1 Tax=Patiria miniata TaxID=46514 RepID=A0A914BDA7_PATMI|nr:adenosine deaminase-like protein isoform X2 [Patiria miniata]
MKVLKLITVELHAHINGSISTESIEELLAKNQEKGRPQPDIEALRQWKAKVENGEQMTLDGYREKNIKICFDMFKLIHQLVDNSEAVAIVTRNVIREFAEDGVKFLELRSTPRDVPETGMTKRSYIEAVLSSIKQCKEEGSDITVRFLLTIDRGRDLQTAHETVQLAREYQATSDGVVVGIDFSGDPNKNDARQYIPVLQEARKSGLKLAIHVAEIPNVAENLSLVQLPPDRIGHGTFLQPEVGGSEELVETVGKLRTPIELCLTSNLVGQTVKSFDIHHFKYWYERGHPCVICTDDKGIFATSLSQEYQIAASTFNLTREQMWELSFGSIACIFADDETKDRLRNLWAQERSKLQSS